MTKTGDFLSDIPQFLKLHVLQKIFETSFRVKICLDICPWTLSVPQSSGYALSENCLFHQILDNVHGKHRRIFFVPNRGNCLSTVNFFLIFVH